MDFVKKSKFLVWVFFTEIVRENGFQWSWIENKHCKNKKIDVLTGTKKWTFFKGVSPWILSKNETFSYQRSFTEIISEHIVFDIVQRKEWFKVEKNWSFKKGQKMDSFQRG